MIGGHTIENGIRPFPPLLMNEMSGRVFPLFIFAGHKVYFFQGKNKDREKTLKNKYLHFSLKQTILFEKTNLNIKFLFF